MVLLQLLNYIILESKEMHIVVKVLLLFWLAFGLIFVTVPYLVALDQIVAAVALFGIVWYFCLYQPYKKLGKEIEGSE